MKNDWKDHPIVIAAISSAATATFIITTVVPTLEKQNINKIKELEQDLALADKKYSSEIEKNNKESQEKDKKIQELKATEKSLKIAIEKLKMDDRYSKAKPFPKGLRDVIVFSEYKSIKTAYPNSTFNQNTIYQSVEIEDDTFSQIVYYPTNCGKTKIVKEIRYFFKTPVDDYEKKALENKLEVTKMPFPKKEEIDSSRAEKKEAVVETFNKIYGPGEKIEESGSNEYLYIINDHLGALATDFYLSIFSRYNQKDIAEVENCGSLADLISP